MKLKYNILICLLLCIPGWNLSAQQIPSGMKYQAVARDASGEVLSDQNITMRVELKTIDQTFYTEEHAIQTNSLGLFDVVIGGGMPQNGKFGDIPWSTEDIWMAVFLKNNERDSEFLAVSESKLLAVPYAFHAITASKLAEGNQNPDINQARGETGEPPIYWTLEGNFGTDAEVNKFGTLDYTDLILVTNNTERLRITADGNITAQKNLEVENDVDVKGGLTVYANVDLNREGGETVNQGPFTVANKNPALFTGPVQVNDETQLRSFLRVSGDVQLDRDLTVDEDLLVKKNLTVNENGNILGDLRVDGISRLNSALFVNNHSNTFLSGGLTVYDAAGFKRSIIVDENATIAGNLYTRKFATIDSVLVVKDQTIIQHQWPDNVFQNEDIMSHHGLILEGQNLGMAIKLNVNTPLPNDNFITFYNQDGEAVGRIEGSATILNGFRQAVSSLINPPDSISEVIAAVTGALGANKDLNQPASPDIPDALEDYLTSDYAYGAIAITIDLVAVLLRLIVNSIACAATVGIGDCDDVVWGATDAVLGLIQLGVYIGWNEVGTGVAFESGGADYAEYLPKADTAENMLYAEVVGVKGGKISKKYTEAEKFMIVSSAPAVIGGAPDAENAHQFTKIAFMGQVPVKVLGETSKGDYILPSGNGDGMAMSVHPDDMLALDYSRVIGISWADSEPDKPFSLINTAVGINSNDLARIVDQMQQTMNEMQYVLQRLDPNYKPTIYQTSSTSPKAPAQSAGYSHTATLGEEINAQLNLHQYNNVHEAMQAARGYLAQHDVDLTDYPYLEDIFNNPTMETLVKAQNHYTGVLNRLQKIAAARP